MELEIIFNRAILMLKSKFIEVRDHRDVVLELRPHRQNRQPPLNCCSLVKIRRESVSAAAVQLWILR